MLSAYGGSCLGAATGHAVTVEEPASKDLEVEVLIALPEQVQLRNCLGAVLEDLLVEDTDDHDGQHGEEKVECRLEPIIVQCLPREDCVATMAKHTLMFVRARVNGK